VSFFGDLERFVSEDLYPYRYMLSVFAVLALAAGLFLAYRLGVHRALWRRKYLSAGIGIPALVVVGIVGYALLSLLWTRTTLIEESPLAASTNKATDDGDDMVSSTPMMDPTADAGMAAETPSGAMTDETPTETPDEMPAFEPRVVSEGEWMGADDFHFARGKALIIETEPGRYVVRVEDFSIRNGPDLFVYLSPDANGYSGDALKLGGLRATDVPSTMKYPKGSTSASSRAWSCGATPSRCCLARRR
jgi:hypothetical protein